MSQSFSFGFGGDDIEQDFHGEEIATENARFVEHHNPISKPQLHAMKDLVRCLLQFFLIYHKSRLIASDYKSLSCSTWRVIGII